MWKKKPDPNISTEIDPAKKYTKTELNDIADAILRKDARSEMCRECGEVGKETGIIKSEAQFTEKGSAITDAHGLQLKIEFPEISCPDGHIWFQGEGQARSISGDNPILFEEHFQSRRKREIYCAIGTPDPSIQQGSYNKTHPQGRKVNSAAQRKKNGASYYR